MMIPEQAAKSGEALKLDLLIAKTRRIMRWKNGE